MDPHKQKTILLADDHALILQALSSQIEKSGRYKIIAKLNNGTEALETILSEKPDIAILDNSMPGNTGLEIAAALKKKKRSHTSLILLTMFGHHHLLAEAYKNGISACVSKSDTPDEIERALDAAISGEFFLSPVFEKEFREIEQTEEVSTSLTPREKEILVSITEGMSTKEIADFLGLSVRTVDHHRERLMRKIGAHNAADVARYAGRMGLYFDS